MTLSGKPQIVGFTPAGQVLAGEAIVRPSQVTLSLGTALQALLAQIEGSAIVVLDSNSGLALASADYTTQQALLSAVNLSCPRAEFTPDEGQTGKALVWHKASATDWASYDISTDALITAVKPAKTLWGFVGTAIQRLHGVNGVPCIVVVDQVNGVVKIKVPTDPGAASEALAGVTGAGESIGIRLLGRQAFE